MELSKDQEKQLDEIQDTAKSVVPMLLETKVIDEKTLESSSAYLKKISGYEKTVKSFFEEPIKNANSVHKWLTGKRKEMLAPWENVKKHISIQVCKFTIEQNNKLKEEKEKLEKESPVAAMAAPEKIKQASGIVIVDNWQFRIINEIEIPREYLIVDESKIKKVIKITQKKTNIPGIEVFNMGSSRVKT